MPSLKVASKPQNMGGWKGGFMLDNLIRAAKAVDASDIHLEAGLPAVLRIRGQLKHQGEALSAETLLSMAKSLIGDAHWSLFLERCSYDLSANLQGVRCRVNVMRTHRGVGLAVRLLSSFQPTLASLNLHPDLAEIARHSHGLVLVSGPTGSGKSSTLAALIQEINLSASKHVITIENPIEYHFMPQQSFIRQREVGRDTPSFSQGLLDALREDPDVLMIGEMREPEIMKLTLNAAETGHLVLATVHSGSVIEALQRVVSAFAPETQFTVQAQIADCLLAVVCQRLIYRPELNLRVPLCEILYANMTVRSIVRSGRFHKLTDVLQSGAADRMWSLSRYQEWLDSRSDWYLRDPRTHQEPVEIPKSDSRERIPASQPDRIPRQPRPAEHRRRNAKSFATEGESPEPDGPYEIKDEDSLEDILRELKK